MSTEVGAEMDTYVVLVVDADEDAWVTMTPADRQAIYDADARFGALLAERGGRVVGGQELDHSRRSRVLRRGPDGTPLRTDGPYAETAEQVSGFYVVQSPSPEALLEAAELMLPVHAALEIRPVPAAED